MNKEIWNGNNVRYESNLEKEVKWRFFFLIKGAFRNTPYIEKMYPFSFRYTYKISYNVILMWAKRIKILISCLELEITLLK